MESIHVTMVAERKARHEPNSMGSLSTRLVYLLPLLNVLQASDRVNTTPSMLSHLLRPTIHLVGTYYLGSLSPWKGFIWTRIGTFPAHKAWDNTTIRRLAPQIQDPMGSDQKTHFTVKEVYSWANAYGIQ